MVKHLEEVVNDLVAKQVGFYVSQTTPQAKPRFISLRLNSSDTRPILLDICQGTMVSVARTTWPGTVRATE